jgi:hypothetical protein
MLVFTFLTTSIFDIPCNTRKHYSRTPLVQQTDIDDSTVQYAAICTRILKEERNYSVHRDISCALLMSGLIFRAKVVRKIGGIS